ncbi:Sec-independent protein translocase subunit TatA [Oerskovia flava]|uniref:Sec-independent protein translocase subunit TatA n=1 Tax=Oerskovia flava TaxID=2986422 RepID=UPI00224088AE|nr:Sec-independent protein translocase subunit TatA [Oerskovia sp. JB1-3-2]
MNIARHPWIIPVLILLVLLLFGSRRLPDMARSVGQSLKIFKKEVKDLREDDDAPAAAPAPTTPTAPQAQDTAPVQPTAPPGTGTGTSTHATGSSPTSTPDDGTPKG